MTKKPLTSQKTVTGRNQPVGDRARAGRPMSRQGRLVASHGSRDSRGTRLAWYVGGGLVLLIALLLGIGYYNDTIAPARETAILIGKHNVSLGYYRDRLKAATVDAGDASQTAAAGKIADTTDAIEEEQIYLRTAASLGTSVSEDDITQQMAKLVHAATQDNKITDQAGYLSLVRLQLQKDGYSLDQFREIARADALKAKANEKFKAEVPRQTLAVKLQELIFTSEQQGRAAQQRLGHGDAVSDIEADSVSDPSIGRAQPIDWTPVPFGVLPAPIDDVASKLQPGQVSDLIKVDAPAGRAASPSSPASTQWYLVAVTDRDPSHDLSDTQVTQIANQKQADWLAAQKQSLPVRSLMDDRAKELWAIQHIGLPVQPPATPTPRGGAPGTVPGTGPGAGPGGPIGPAAPGQSPPQSGPPGGAGPAAPPVPPVPAGTVPAVPSGPSGNP